MTESNACLVIPLGVARGVEGVAREGSERGITEWDR